MARNEKNWFYHTALISLSAVVVTATIAFFFYIKLFVKDSKLFRNISVAQALVFLAIMILFIVAGIIHKNRFLDSVLH